MHNHVDTDNTVMMARGKRGGGGAVGRVLGGRRGKEDGDICNSVNNKGKEKK